MFIKMSRVKNKRIFWIINWTLLIIVIGLVLEVFTFSKKNQNEKEVVVNRLTFLALKQLHYQPKTFDNKLSEEIFDEFISTVDNGKRFFLKPDIKRLGVYRDLIDDLIRNSEFDFFKKTMEIYDERFSQVRKFYPEILSKPFDFNTDETIELDPEKLDWAKNDKELYERWRKMLKYETLMRLNTYLELKEKAKDNDTTYKNKTFAQLEEKARKEVKKQYDDWFDWMDKLREEDWFGIYINSITGVFDPHTTYFPPKQEEDFKIYMSGKFQGIGATLTSKNGEIKVVKLIPGGAAWRQGELEVGDVILKVAQGDQPPVSIVGMRLDDAVRLIRGKKGTVVRLTVRKVDGTIKEISIIRDDVIIEETYARSAIIKDGNKKYGYLYLPSFYADFSNPQGRRASTDVAFELKKMNDEGIDGLIIDLRNNGGGSLQDVIDIVGYFIDKGPVVQVRDRKGKIQVYKDEQEGTLYDGPLMVMVNEFSASASEIFSAAIQDYDRGVIFGAKHTFGKGSVQNMIDYDRWVEGMNSIKPLGALKLTIQKYYRIDGGSTQLKGVIPDIIVPDQYEYIKIGEREDKYALAWDQIKPAKYKKWTPPYNEEELKKKADNLIKSDSVYKIIDDYAKYLKKYKDQTEVSLNLEKYRKDVKERRQKSKAYNSLSKKNNNLNLDFLKDDKLLMKDDSLMRMRYQDWMKTLKKDKDLPTATEVMRLMENK